MQAHFVLPHMLVLLPKAAKILIVLLRYARKMKMVVELCSIQPPHVPITKLPSECKGLNQRKEKRTWMWTYLT